MTKRAMSATSISGRRRSRSVLTPPPPRQALRAAHRPRRAEHRRRRFPGRRLGHRTLRRRGATRRPVGAAENGILVGCLWDLARAADHGSDGTRPVNGRRRNYQCLPPPHMTNTLVLPGTTAGADILADTKSGIHVARPGPARVITATGDFVFTAEEVYAIRDGQLYEPLADRSLVGHGPTVLREIRRDRLGHCDGASG
ncbi:metallopeptidase TldD-related protein [Streptomyces sp. FXY-T5]|nr:metallopeptidase TldD-related protein [Streptomyces sp. FXY-T5]WMD06139.1 metallopeptidase TldD-related protein [Streptomyces sp. FXY-T5]